MERVQKIKQRIFIYMLLAVYVFALVKPITPIAADIIAHTFFKVRHMATVHYENGTFHVHKELKKASEKSNPVNTRNLVTETLCIHLQNEPIIVPVSSVHNLPLNVFYYINFPVDICLKSTTPPPKA